MLSVDFTLHSDLSVLSFLNKVVVSNSLALLIFFVPKLYFLFEQRRFLFNRFFI